MTTLLNEWIGKRVHLTLRATISSSFEGILLKADATGILMEAPKGVTFVPLTSILHVSLMA